jgi:hypothetical protein
MRELQIVFTKSKKKMAIFSKLIMWWTKKPYSHVAKKVIRQDWGAGYYQASEGNVNYEHQLIFDTKHEIVKDFTLIIDTKLEMDIRKACWQECGNKYGMMQNIGIFLIDLGLLKKNPWKHGRNCSELLYVKVLKRILPHLDYNPDTIKPHHIEEIILECFEKQLDGRYTVKLSTTNRD